jgi:hypothetical protein
MIVPLVCGIIIDYLGEVGKKVAYPELGYTVIFSMAIIWFLLTMLAVKKIQLTNRSHRLLHLAPLLISILSFHHSREV